MSNDTNAKFRDAFVAQFAPDMASAAVTIADGILQKDWTWSGFCPDGGATTNTSVLLESSSLGNVVFSSVKFSVTANVTADNTNNAVFSLVYNNGNGGADTTIATVNTASAAAGGTGNITKDTPTTCTINTSNATVPSGSALYWKVTKAGSGGLAMTNGTSLVARAKAAP